MKKHKTTLIMILSVFILASSFLLLKLEKKQTQVFSYTIILKNKALSGDSLLQTYGSAIYQISPLALQRIDSAGYSLFLESKLYSATVPAPKTRFCMEDSSLSITIHNNYAMPDQEDIQDNPIRSKKLTNIFLKYQ